MSKTLLVALVVGILAASGAILLYAPGVFQIASPPKNNESTKVATSHYSSSPQYSQFLTEFPTPTPNSLPNAVCVDSQGNVWTVLQNDTALGVFFPSNSSYKTFTLPEKSGTLVTTWGIAIDNTRHFVWFTDEQSNAVWRFNTTSRTFEKYSIKSAAVLPYQVALDNQGNAWFTEFSGDKLGEITPNGSLTEIPIPLAPSEPTGIAVDSKTGKVWFNLLTTGLITEFFVGSYFRGSFTFSNITSLVDTPVGISLDSSGNLWLTQHGASFISEYNPANETFRTISTSIPPAGASYPYFTYFDPNTGNVWFNEHYGNSIGEFIPSTNSLVEYLIPTKLVTYGNISGSLTMGLSPSGTPWFTELYAGKLGEINTTAPLGLSISVNGSGLSNGRVALTNGSSADLSISVGSNSQTESLSASLGNFTGSFTFNFAQFSGDGNFGTTMTIKNNGSPRGIYFATISVKNNDLVVSKIIEIVVQ